MGKEEPKQEEEKASRLGGRPGEGGRQEEEGSASPFPHKRPNIRRVLGNDDGRLPPR
jgi:hypothetical protein